jgi:hypothetical protein
MTIPGVSGSGVDFTQNTAARGCIMDNKVDVSRRAFLADFEFTFERHDD